jgi:oxygen-independent coproporphyrinogen III oxidase
MAAGRNIQPDRGRRAVGAPQPLYNRPVEDGGVTPTNLGDGILAPDVQRLAAALGPAARVAYAPPNIFPMSNPTFSRERRDRPRAPSGDRLSVYVHVPFCNYHCNFCFFATRVGTPRDEMERYVRAALRELEWLEPGFRLTQLYVGGGTPTVLPPDLLDTILAAVFDRVHGGEEAHTVECSPESLTDEHVRVLREHGIGRVSMGIQSLSQPVLERIERAHDARQAIEACDRLVAAGLIVNVDLIYGLPGQEEDDFARDFETAAAHGIHSVTTYNLRVNERTPVARLVADDEQLELARLVRWRALVAHTASGLGFVQTRAHTFRREHGTTEAQQRAGRFQDVTGYGEQFSIGLSARSRLRDVIYRNQRGFFPYIESVERGESPVQDVFPLGDDELKTRFLAKTLGDRLALERPEYEEQLGSSFDDDFGTTLQRLVDEGLLEDDARRVSMTATGRLVYDLVLLAFYPESTRKLIQDRQTAAPAARGS